jgi:ABC-type Fe3+-hydroxamate transport system substrate-binding protein
MGYRLALIGAIFLVFAGSRVAEERIGTPSRLEVSPRWQCRRIVSMAPSITEVLHGLGLADRVVGVDWDEHCPASRGRVDISTLGWQLNCHPNISGQTFLSAQEIAAMTADRNVCPTPSIEAILWLKPDLVIMLEEQAAAQATFERFKIETLVVSHRSVDDVAKSFRTIGRLCGKGVEGRRMGRE